MKKTEAVKVILISDVHLESSKDGKRVIVLEALNKEVKAVREAGFLPVVVCAGDIANGTDAYKMLEHIEADVIYVAGNHEFWGGDFYEINNALIKEKPSNVHYLYNDLVVIGDTMFAGSTMWTDVGLKTNPDVSRRCTHTMRDVSKITAIEWYKNPQNLKNLKELYSFNEDLIEAAFLRNAWNILIEREENKKTVDFFNALVACLEFKEVYGGEHKSIDDEMNDKFSFAMVREMAVQGHKSLVKKVWLKVKATSEMKVVAVTHHLPFFEEMSVGTYNKNNAAIKSFPVFLNKVDKAWLNISSGENYGYDNYFFLVAKGEFSKQESIPSIFHYMNNGSRLFHQKLPKFIKNWIHGHEHHYAFIDYVKGIKVATSPMGQVGGLVFSDTGMVVRYPKADMTEEEKKEVDEKITQNFYAVNLPTAMTPKILVNEWCWYLLREKSLFKQIEMFEITTKQKISTLKKLWREYVDYERLSPKLMSQVELWDSSQKGAVLSIISILDEMKEAINLRTNEDYSYLRSLCVDKTPNNYSTVLESLEINFKNSANIDLLRQIARKEVAFFSVEDVFRMFLGDVEEIQNSIEYLKVAAEYYSDAFKNIDVYSMASFEENLHLVKFNHQLKRRLKATEKIYREKAYPLQRFMPNVKKSKRVRKTLTQKFFE